MNNEIKRIIFDKERFTESEYPFQIKQNFSMFGSIIRIQPHGPIVSFVFEVSLRNLLGFLETILQKEYNQSTNLVDKISLDKIFIETDDF